jgi:hypothetical protein
MYVPASSSSAPCCGTSVQNRMGTSLVPTRLSSAFLFFSRKVKCPSLALRVDRTVGIFSWGSVSVFDCCLFGYQGRAYGFFQWLPRRIGPFSDVSLALLPVWWGFYSSSTLEPTTTFAWLFVGDHRRAFPRGYWPLLGVGSLASR